VPSLKNISCNFKFGRLYGITGKVGSGKSGLIGAILKEIPYYSGSMQINGKIAYVEQEPVTFSDTVKNNIIFGRTYI
jgi:ATP-binding cassette, subfamily C (CFTR/MRP), member 4